MLIISVCTELPTVNSLYSCWLFLYVQSCLQLTVCIVVDYFCMYRAACPARRSTRHVQCWSPDRRGALRACVCWIQTGRQLPSKYAYSSAYKYVNFIAPFGFNLIKSRTVTLFYKCILLYVLFLIFFVLHLSDYQSWLWFKLLCSDMLM